MKVSILFLGARLVERLVLPVAHVLSVGTFSHIMNRGLIEGTSVMGMILKSYSNLVLPHFSPLNLVQQRPLVSD